MRSPNMKNSKRFAAGIMGFMMLLIVLFSAFYVSAEVNHNCTGDSCPVCAVFRQCENSLRQIGNGESLPLAANLPFVIFFISISSFACILSKATPVTRKVRLNN